MSHSFSVMRSPVLFFVKVLRPCIGTSAYHAVFANFLCRRLFEMERNKPHSEIMRITRVLEERISAKSYGANFCPEFYGLFGLNRSKVVSGSFFWKLIYTFFRQSQFRLRYCHELNWGRSVERRPKYHSHCSG